MWRAQQFPFFLSLSLFPLSLWWRLLGKAQILQRRTMGLLSNRIGTESLKPGDHIYSWRTAYIYAHHGIYVGNDKVVHFTRGRGQEMGTGTILDVILASSAPARSPCSSCTHLREDLGGVVSSCLLCFLGGGVLYRFEYEVSPALFIAKARGGTCTTAIADEPAVVVHRANYLLGNGFRGYNVFNSNCEDFAIYCKTGLIAMDQGVMGQSGQAISLVGGPLAAAFSTPVRLLSANVYGMAAAAVGVYCVSRYFADIGNRMDVVKVAVEDLPATVRLENRGEVLVLSPAVSDKEGSSLR
ncbi:NC domain-containing protein-like protein [Wolffia australiana]